jgi:hypothetical protein
LSEEVEHVRRKEKLHHLRCTQNIIRIIKSRKMRWAGLVARMGEMINAYNILAGKPERRRPLGRPRCKWEGNINI